MEESRKIRLAHLVVIAGCWLMPAMTDASASQSVPAGSQVIVPAGAFTMGRDDGPADERPAHRITLPAFRIDRLPVTNHDFARFLNVMGTVATEGLRRYDADDGDARIHRHNGQWMADAGHESHPVVEVTWVGARDYCHWRNARLPTEAEWEKAARGDDGRLYPWGSASPDATRARHASAFNATAPVNAHPAGASVYGAIDMAGNAWEWVSSAYRPYPYRVDDGREDQTPGPVRATRGGGHDSPASEITTTERGGKLSRNPRAGHHNIAFRCAREK